MIFGPGGYGKSHITVDIAARLTTGEPLPGREERTRPRKVLMLSAEDEFDAVLVPRLIKAGANLDRVALPAAPFTLDGAGIRQVEEYMREFEATVVFIDPMVHYIGAKVDMNRMNEVRAVTGALHQAAIHSNSAVILVHHARKGQEGQDFDKAAGSADFNNAVRSVLFTTKTNDGTRVLRHVKSNYAKLGPSLAYDFGDKGFEWVGSYEEGILQGAATSRKGAKGKAQAFIHNLLKDGPVAAKEVELSAKDEGFNARTLSRAKEGLAESFPRREEGVLHWYWRLIGDTRAPLNSGDFLNAQAQVSGMEERRTADVRERGPERSGDSSVDPGALGGSDGAGGPVASSGRRQGSASDPLQSSLSARALEVLASRRAGL